ncbi:MAG TPA: VWA domain-containing protein [Polyangiales bacterium]|nr:VWA domain-containing protein [Polyangiales bacterium]
MNAKTKRIGLAVFAGFFLGTISVYAVDHDAHLRLGPTPAHAAEQRGPSAPPQLTAADGPAWDPLAADRDLARPKVLPPLAANPGEVKLSARLDRNAVLVGSDGRLQVELTLTAPDSVRSDAPRHGNDVLVILDVSGSMSGQKLAYAKRALHQLIDRVGPRDRFGLITYESDAQLVLPLQAASDRSVARWHHAVDRLEARGGTNMSAGLDFALSQLSGGHHSARVLLLSDGLANEGDSSPSGLAARARRIARSEDVLTTMGIGDDFNEDLMTSLAEIGTGNFYYLSRVEMIGRFFDAEFRASAETVAAALELHIELSSGSRVLSVSGYPIEQSSGAVTIRPGNLYAGQKRTLWVTLEMPVDRTGEVAPPHFSLTYKRDEYTHSVVADALPALRCVADRDSFEHAIDREVWERAITTDEFQRRQLALGKAIGEGDGADVDREVKSYAQNRALAEKLGSQRVLDSIDALDGAATRAKAAQAAPAAARSFEAKQRKAQATFGLRRDAYNDDPSAGMN